MIGTMREWFNKAQHNDFPDAKIIITIKETMTEGIPELSPSDFVENDKKRFCKIAAKIYLRQLGGRGDNKEQAFSKILDNIEKDIDEMVRRDDMFVSAMVCIFGSIRKNKEYIFDLVDSIPARLEKTREALKQHGFDFKECDILKLYCR